jgi:hypothetical protein
MALQGLPMFVRQEITEFILRGMGVVGEVCKHKIIPYIYDYFNYFA